MEEKEVRRGRLGEGGAELGRSQGGARAGRGTLVWAGRAREHLFLLHKYDRRDELPSSWKMGSLLRRSGGCGGEVGTGQRGGGAVAGTASPPLAHPWTTRTEPAMGPANLEINPMRLRQSNSGTLQIPQCNSLIARPVSCLL